MHEEKIPAVFSVINMSVLDPVIFSVAVDQFLCILREHEPCYVSCTVILSSPVLLLVAKSTFKPNFPIFS